MLELLVQITLVRFVHFNESENILVEELHWDTLVASHVELKGVGVLFALIDCKRRMMW